MKQLILLLIISISLLSCSDTNMLEPLQTGSDCTLTVRQQEEIVNDTTTYKLYDVGNDYLYIINSTTNKVEYKIVNHTGNRDTSLLFFMIIICLIIIGISTAD